MIRTAAGVVLAAGEGRRFGRPKALVEFDGVPLVERALSVLRAGGCRPVVVVLGAAAAEVQNRCRLGDALVAVNERWAEGMGGSLRAGLEEAGAVGAEAVLVMPVDQPIVSAELVSRLLDAWRGGAKAAVASFAGEGRTPVVLDRSVWAEVSAAAVGELGARALLRSRPEIVTLVECADAGDASDIDTPEDLARLEQRQRASAAGAERPPPG